MSHAALRDPASDFVNRFAEKLFVKDFCEGRAGEGKRCLVLRTVRDVGLTFFLRHLEQTAARPWFAIYVDCASSDPEIIFRRFFEKLEQRRLARWTAWDPIRELGETFIRLLSPIFFPAAIASAAGSIAATAVTKVLTTPYASLPSERFAKLILSGRWLDPVLFLVDNAQEISPQSLHILNTVYSDRYDHVRFVLAHVTDAAARDGYEPFLQRLLSFGLGVSTQQFRPPNEQFVAEIAAALNIPLKSAERRELVRKTEGSVSRIIGCLRAERATDTSLTDIERELLRYLLVAAQPLRIDDVLALVRNSPRLASPEPSVRAALLALERKRLVLMRKHWLGDELEAVPGQLRPIREAVPVLGDLAAAQELYHYFTIVDDIRSPRHSQTAYGSLLFKLAKLIDPVSVGKRAFDLVRISLAQADLEAARKYVADATAAGTPQSVYDTYAVLAFHVSVQEYKPVLDAVESLGREYWMQSRVLRIIHAVAQNRVRSHDSADGEIDELLTDPITTDEEFALLISYKVAGLLHEGELDIARATFERAHGRLQGAQNRGYAFRNCAAVYFWGPGRDHARAREVLAQALATFRSQDDQFGVYTTLNNRGALKGSMARGSESAAAALDDFTCAFEALSVFGTQHLEEVSANVGTALLISGDVDRAKRHLTKVAPIIARDFPRVIVESALAFAEAMSGDLLFARERLRNLTSWVAEVALPEAVYRAHVNAAVIEALAETGTNRFDAHIRSAEASGFWVTHSLRRVAIAAAEGAIKRERLADFFSYDYFQYWSQNPLSIVTLVALPDH